MNDIKNCTREELKQELAEIKEPAYRAGQLFAWLYSKGVYDFGKMGNLAKPLRDKLKKRYLIGALTLSEHLCSADGTEKFLFKLRDGNFIETVLISAGERKTICLSTQVGCKFKCLFCASGRMGFARNLVPAEISGQILFLWHSLKYKTTNYVFMGMGEPLDNYANVAKAIRIMNDAQGMDIGARRITISTCGIIPGIKKLKDLGLQVNLSLSLHAADNKLRNKLMPVNKRYPLEKLVKACEDYIAATGRMMTLEYILIKDVNDSGEAAAELAVIAKKLKAKVNLIAYSPVFEGRLQAPRREDAHIFMSRLLKKKVAITLRESKGKDIQAACGQLAGRKKNAL